MSLFVLVIVESKDSSAAKQGIIHVDVTGIIIGV